MHEPHHRLNIEVVLVECLQLQAVVEHGVDCRVDLIGQENEVTVEQGAIGAYALKPHLATQFERRIERHPAGVRLHPARCTRMTDIVAPDRYGYHSIRILRWSAQYPLEELGIKPAELGLLYRPGNQFGR